MYYSSANMIHIINTCAWETFMARRVYVFVCCAISIKMDGSLNATSKQQLGHNTILTYVLY